MVSWFKSSLLEVFNEDAEETTRNKILNAARQLFAQKGFAATPISEIARKAKIHQSLIYHHFQNKIDLWKQVKEHIGDRYKNLSEAKLEEVLTLRDFLSQMVVQKFELYERHPEVLRLILWQSLESDNLHTLEIDEKLSEEWSKGITYLQQRGEINSAFEPDLLIEFISNSIAGIYIQGRWAKIEEIHRRHQYIQMVIECLEKSLKPTKL